MASLEPHLGNLCSAIQSQQLVDCEQTLVREWMDGYGSALYQCPSSGVILGLAGNDQNMYCFACGEDFKARNVLHHLRQHELKVGYNYCVPCGKHVLNAETHSHSRSHRNAVAAALVPGPVCPYHGVVHGRSGMSCANHHASCLNIRRIQLKILLEKESEANHKMIYMTTGQQINAERAQMLSEPELLILVLFRNVSTLDVAANCPLSAPDPLSQFMRVLCAQGGGVSTPSVCSYCRSFSAVEVTCIALQLRNLRLKAGLRLY